MRKLWRKLIASFKRKPVLVPSYKYGDDQTFLVIKTSEEVKILGRKVNRFGTNTYHLALPDHRTVYWTEVNITDRIDRGFWKIM